MKSQLFKSYLLLFSAIITLSACISTKKYKNLELEKLRMEATLLNTKQELSDAKRELNKIKDASTSQYETHTETIVGLKQSLEESSAALDAVQNAVVDCQNKLQTAENQIKNQEKQKEELTALYEVQKNLEHQNKSLQSIQEDIKNLLIANIHWKISCSLYKDELILSFEHDFLFAGQALSNEGKIAIYQLTEIFKKYSTVYLDINAHTATGGDETENWKNSTRKALTVLSTLTQRQVAPDNLRIIAYGEYKPIADNTTPEGKKQNNRTEIVLRYQNTQLLKLIPINNN